MSILLMTQAFKTPLPTTQKFVFVALCDAANDQGECYPSIATVCEKTSLGERAVQTAVRQLETLGYVRREFRSGRSTVYWLTATPAADAPPRDVHPRTPRTPARRAPPHQVHPTPAPHAPPPPQDVHPTPAPGAPITVKEPSVEPKENRAAPAGARVLAGFERFWAAWPSHHRKAAREQCAVKWRTKRCEENAAQVLAALEAAKASEAWAKDNGAYIPAPHRWLNEARWEAPTEAQVVAQQEELTWRDTPQGVDRKARELGMLTWAEYEAEKIRKGIAPHFAVWKLAVVAAAAEKEVEHA